MGGKSRRDKGESIIMKGSSLGVRLVVSTLAVFLATCLVFSFLTWRVASNWVERDASAEAERQSARVVESIKTIDLLSQSQVETGMRILKEQALLKGVPALRGVAEVAGKTVPDLHLGSYSQVLSFDVVDHVKELAGGTATLFVWDGTNFVRVSTNVMKPDGTRAVGTVLDAKGKAFAALYAGQAFHGVVDILGVPYTTSYVPMLDADGKLAGAWYTGYRLDSIAALGRSIQDAVILDHGFVALVKPSGAVVFHGSQVSDETVSRMRNHPAGWVVRETPYAPWGYTVLTAFPVSDVTGRILRVLGMMACGTLILVVLVSVLQFVLLNRLVLGPVKELTEHLETADLNTLLPTGRTDEIGRLAASFNQYVLRLRQALFQVRNGAAATTSKSDEIRSISDIAVANMAAQCMTSEDAAVAVERLSRQVASISSHTQDASRQARSAAEAARRGSELVNAAVDRIKGLAQDTAQSMDRIARLSAHAKQVGSIVGVIEEIAAGTNLLALNASIEAARAGEHGRGFAVVAGEVRRLAERTAEATRQVGGLVSGIAAETEQTAAGIDSACLQAEKGAETVASLKGTFERIVEMVVEVDGRVEQIASSANQEAAAASSVSETMHQVASSSKESAKGIEQVVGATGELLDTARNLEGMVEQFHLMELPQDYAA